MDEQEFLPIRLLREPKVRLRDVDRESIDYLELRDSIRDHNVLQPLLVRPIGDVYEIIEGCYRFAAAKDAGKETVPCLIRQCSDDEALVLMLQANAISPETKLAEYAQQLKRIQRRNPGITNRELSCLIRKSPSWVGKCLLLNNLRKEIRVMVDRGEIPSENAYMLAKIPRTMQLDYVDHAKVMPCGEFRSLAATCVKQYMEAVKQGKMDAFYSDTFQAQGHLRHMTEIETELEKKEVGALICASEGCQSTLDGFYAGLRWACHLDPSSIRQREAIVRRRRERQVLDVQLND